MSHFGRVYPGACRYVCVRAPLTAGFFSLTSSIMDRKIGVSTRLPGIGPSIVYSSVAAHTEFMWQLRVRRRPAGWHSQSTAGASQHTGEALNTLAMANTSASLSPMTTYLKLPIWSATKRLPIHLLAMETATTQPLIFPSKTTWSYAPSATFSRDSARLI